MSTQPFDVAGYLRDMEIRRAAVEAYLEHARRTADTTDSEDTEDNA
jgi:hypothetical protein